MNDKVVNIHPPTVEENILAALDKAKKEGTTDELYVLRSYRGEDGLRHLEWFTTACDSRIWSVGALYYLAHKLMEGAGGYWAEDEDESA